MADAKADTVAQASEEAPKQQQPPPQGKFALFMHQHVKPFAFVVLILCMVRSSIADWNDVPTGSMNPSIIEGDRIFVNKLAYDLKVPFTTWHVAQWGEPNRGDVVVFYQPKTGIRMVKHVVGLPGDTVMWENSRLYVNGVAASYGPADPAFAAAVQGRPMVGPISTETFGGRTHPMMELPQRPAYRDYAAVVPQGQYFLMGDNRDNSADSREWGFCPREQIVGRATAVAISFDPDHTLSPRWGRFFTWLP